MVVSEGKRVLCPRCQRYGKPVIRTPNPKYSHLKYVYVVHAKNDHGFWTSEYCYIGKFDGDIESLYKIDLRSLYKKTMERRKLTNGHCTKSRNLTNSHCTNLTKAHCTKNDSLYKNSTEVMKDDKCSLNKFTNEKKKTSQQILNDNDIFSKSSLNKFDLNSLNKTLYKKTNAKENLVKSLTNSNINNVESKSEVSLVKEEDICFSEKQITIDTFLKVYNTKKSKDNLHINNDASMTGKEEGEQKSSFNSTILYNIEREYNEGGSGHSDDDLEKMVWKELLQLPKINGKYGPFIFKSVLSQRFPHIKNVYQIILRLEAKGYPIMVSRKSDPNNGTITFLEMENIEDILLKVEGKIRRNISRRRHPLTGLAKKEKRVVEDLKLKIVKNIAREEFLRYEQLLLWARENKIPQIVLDVILLVLIEEKRLKPLFTCKKCGRILKEDEQYCPNCGKDAILDEFIEGEFCLRPLAVKVF